MSIIYYNEYNEEEDGLWLACGIGNRSHLVLVDLDGDLGWCSNDRIVDDSYC